MIKVLKIEHLGGHRLRLLFSDGREGDADLGELLSQDGPMLAPLRNAHYFGRVFLDHGVPTWPNGFDLDAEALHRELVGREANSSAPAAA